MPRLYPYVVASPDIMYLKRMLVGLLETFPSYSQDFFMYYLYTKEGVQSYYTIGQLAKVALKKGEKPIVKDTYKCSWVCNESEDSSDKENIPVYANKTNNCSLIPDKSTTPLKCLDGYQVVSKRNEAIQRRSNEFQSIEQIRSNLLEQIEEEGINGYPMFYTEERSDSLNDEDYEYIQLNTSTLKELSELGRDSTEKKNIEGRISCIMDSELFCTESINEVFKN